MKPHPDEKKPAKHKPGHEHGHKAEHKPDEEGKELRRAFEHLGRVRAISGHAGQAHAVAANTHFELAFHRGQRALEMAVKEGATPRQKRAAADLLRSAEHLAFAELEGGAKSDRKLLTGFLKKAIQKEFKKLDEKAADKEKQSPDEWIRKLQEQVRKEARKALDGEHYRRALELIRGAEALAHVPGQDEPADTDEAAA